MQQMKRSINAPRGRTRGLKNLIYNPLIVAFSILLIATLSACGATKDGAGRGARLIDRDRGAAIEGARLLELGEAAEAEAILRDLSRRYPQDRALSIALADALLALERSADAQRAIEPFSASSSVELEAMRAKIALASGDTVKAEAILFEARSTYPESATPLLMLLEIEREPETTSSEIIEALSASLPRIAAPPLPLFERGLELAFRAEEHALVYALAERLVEAHPLRARELLKAYEPRLVDAPALFLQLILPFEDEPEIVGLKLAAREKLRNRRRDR